ncbi:helix-turn-helix transcriptional regulator [Lactobacillus intestinalis]|uniref:helix-turn-helix domain-containing protein n=1 Tax=Lactobacillus intestinalis TaxID=151781 RepID=UPI0026F19B06|nr:helix-turn-helix transcriptional regulator [Lactobacillus intestinalis]
MGRSNLTPSEIKAKKTISANLNTLLLKSGKKKIDIQRETKIPRSTVSDYFSGKTLPSEENVEKLSKVFDVSVSDIDPRYKDKVVDVEDTRAKNIAEEKMLVAFRKQTAGMSEDDQIKFQRSLNKLMDAAKDLNSLGE